MTLILRRLGIRRNEENCAESCFIEGEAQRKRQHSYWSGRAVDIRSREGYSLECFQERIDRPSEEAGTLRLKPDQRIANAKPS